MAFSEQQLKRIERDVGGLCERRAPPDLKDRIRLRYEINNHNVLIREARPDWRNPLEWTESDGKRASGKWWLYEPNCRSMTLSAMVNEIDTDSYGCFFG